MQIRKAYDADLGEIRNLLNANGLPVEDVSRKLIEGFLVAEDASGAFVGSGGLEHLGASVFLRSLAVASELRGTGIARKLIAQLEDNAHSLGQQKKRVIFWSQSVQAHFSVLARSIVLVRE